MGITRAQKAYVGINLWPPNTSKLKLALGGPGIGLVARALAIQLLGCVWIPGTHVPAEVTRTPVLLGWGRRQEELEACWPANVVRKTISLGLVSNPVSRE